MNKKGRKKRYFEFKVGQKWRNSMQELAKHWQHFFFNLERYFIFFNSQITSDRNLLKIKCWNKFDVESSAAVKLWNALRWRIVVTTKKFVGDNNIYNKQKQQRVILTPSLNTTLNFFWRLILNFVSDWIGVCVPTNPISCLQKRN